MSSARRCDKKKKTQTPKKPPPPKSSKSTVRDDDEEKGEEKKTESLNKPPQLESRQMPTLKPMVSDEEVEKAVDEKTLKDMSILSRGVTKCTQVLQGMILRVHDDENIPRNPSTICSELDEVFDEFTLVSERLYSLRLSEDLPSRHLIQNLARMEARVMEAKEAVMVRVTKNRGENKVPAQPNNLRSSGHDGGTDIHVGNNDCTPFSRNQRSPDLGNQNQETDELQGNQNNLQQDVAQLLLRSTLPTLEPMVFNDDKTKYLSFKHQWTTFVSKKTQDPAEKMSYLVEYTKVGSLARATVAPLANQATLASVALEWNKLDKLFGNPTYVAKAHVDKIESYDVVTSTAEMLNFSSMLSAIQADMAGVNKASILNTDKVIQSVLIKLPDDTIAAWERHCSRKYLDDDEEIPFSELVDFIENQALSRANPRFGRDEVLKTKRLSSCHPPPAQTDQVKSHRAPRNQKFAKTLATSTKSQPAPDEKQNRGCKFCGQRNHNTLSCFKLRDCPRAAKISFLYGQKICTRCGQHRQGSHECGKTECKTCGGDHLTILHPDGPDDAKKSQVEMGRGGGPAQRQNDSNEDGTKSSIAKKTVSNSNAKNQTQRSETIDWSNIIPVYVYSKSEPDHKVMVYCCVDGESNSSWVTQDFAESNGWLTSASEDMVLETIETSLQGTRPPAKPFSIVDDLILESRCGTASCPLPRLYVTNRVPASHDNIPDPEGVKRFSHLRQAAPEFPPVDPNKPIALLLGRNCPDVLAFTSVVPGSPCVLKTKYGASIQFCNKEAPERCFKTVVTSETSAILVEPKPPDADGRSLSDPLCQKILDVMESDFKSDDPTELNSYSRLEEQFLEQVRTSTNLTENGYEIDLPFTGRNEPVLPNNKHIALRQLKQVHSRMMKNSKYREEFLESFATDLRNGYIEKAPDEGKDGQTNYLIYHGTHHPKSKKFRKVYNVPFRSDGMSLEDFLLPGPNLTGHLAGCLLRFRKGKIAFTTDIQAMFCQVKVPAKQRDFLRLLWFDYDDDGSVNTEKVAEYRVTHHLFGAPSSPSVASYALQRTALDNEGRFSVAALELVAKHFYVDDGCSSSNDETVARQLCPELIELLKHGGFNAHKFMSNSREVLKGIDPDHLAKDLDSRNLDNCVLPLTNVLGLTWDPSSDVLRFSVSFPDKPLTRAGILACYASVFDPTGILAPLLLEARLISQELCRLGVENDDALGWSDEVPPEYAKRWTVWRDKMAVIDGFEVQRCLIPPDFDQIATAQLHHFGDASDKAYGCCSYLRVTDKRGRIHVTLLAAKSKVCPKAFTSLPRKELTSLKTATELALFLRRELMTESTICTYPKIEDLFYSDSTIALGMIGNDEKELKIFCANRASYIVRNTDQDKWFHVSGLQNPADYASRGIDPLEFSPDHPFLKGPGFLWEPEDEWRPSLVNCKGIKLQDESEVKRPKNQSKTMTTSLTQTQASTQQFKPCEEIATLVSRHSTLEAAQSQVKALTDFVDFMVESHSRKKSASIKSKQSETPSELYLVEPQAEKLQRALFAILRMAQRQAFGDEYQSIGREVVVAEQEFIHVKSSSSALLALSPFYDRNLGLIRVGGRLNNADGISYEERHPIILPDGHHVTVLLIDYHHRKCRHAGFNITLGRIRQAGFWIVKGPSQVKQVIGKCVICRRLRSGELSQKMAPLPIERTNAGLFVDVGLDVFGHFEIKLRRGTVKRWVAIFVCFSSRAIHLEKLVDMSTDRFMNALSRFLNRRGPVRRLWCDRGTNFVGASNEIRKSLDSMDKQIKDKLATQYGVDYFRFGYPFSSHKNGHVERQIRTVRSTLNQLLFEYKDRIDDDTMDTFLCEAEGIVNSRPLSALCLNDSTVTPISPMTILTQKTSVVTALPGDSVKEDMYLRKSYKQARFMADALWQKWRQQYLSELQRRDKWFFEKRSLQVGDVVLLKDDALHRNHWPLARVVKVIVDSDGLTRKATVSTSSGTPYDRPISRMILLVPIEEQ